MKTKFHPITQILQIPGSDAWMIQRQFKSYGPVHTDDNDGQGYTEDQAFLKTFGTTAQETV